MALTAAEREQLAPLMATAEAEGWASWVRDDRDRLAMLEGCRFEVATAERLREFCRRFLRLENPTPRDGRGLMLPLELLDFQYEDILGPIVGWKRAHGSRRFRSAFVTIGKGNTKSVLAAVLLLFLNFAEGEPVPLGFACSTSADAARNVFDFASRMVTNSPALSRRLKVIDSKGRIIDPRSGAMIRIAPNKAQAVEGKNVHASVYDEIHLAKDRDLYDALVYGGRSRSQPLMVVITTAAADKTGLAYELFEDAVKIRDGVLVDSSQFVYIAAADHEDDPLDPATWAKANPALGVTVNEADLAAAAKQAAASPAKMVNFKRRRLNVWGLNDTNAFLDLDRWLDCRDDVSAADLAGRDCYGGLDLASNTDLTVFTAAFPAEDGSIDVLAWHWLPEDVLVARAKTDCDRYPEWAAAELLETTPGDYIDQPYILARILEICGQFNVLEIAYDPTFAADLGPKLAARGLEVFEFWQTHRMYTPVMAKLDELVLAKKIRHQNPLLDWQASNLLAHTNEAGHMKPAKPSKGAKIDGMCALLMSLGRFVKGQADEDDGYDFCPVVTLDATDTGND